jgi:hypothetical protein
MNTTTRHPAEDLTPMNTTRHPAEDLTPMNTTRHPAEDATLMNATTRSRPVSFTSPSQVTPPRCVTCGRAFDFDAGETAVVLRHIAYGYDLAHDGACLAAATDQVFVEPGFDVAAFGCDRERTRILQITPADGWFAARSEAPQHVLAGCLLRFEPLRWWALVERSDGSRRFESITQDADWDNAPGGLEFPEARRGSAACIGYTRQPNQPSTATRARWAALVTAAHRGQPIRLTAPASVRERAISRAA